MVCWYINSVEKSNETYKALFVVCVDLPPWLISIYQWFKNQLTNFLNIKQLALESQCRLTPTTIDSANRALLGEVAKFQLELECKGKILQKGWHWAKTQMKRGIRKLKVIWKNSSGRKRYGKHTKARNHLAHLKDRKNKNIDF